MKRKPETQQAEFAPLINATRNNDFRFHHVGLVSSNLEESMAFYEGLGYSPSEIFADPIQKARIVLLRREHDPIIELVSPDHSDSPAASWLQRVKGGPYHLCYEVGDVEDVITHLRSRRLFLVLGPVPAVAFDMRSVAFLWSDQSGLIELLQASGS